MSSDTQRTCAANVVVCTRDRRTVIVARTHLQHGHVTDRRPSKYKRRGPRIFDRRERQEASRVDVGRAHFGILRRFTSYPKVTQSRGFNFDPSRFLAFADHAVVRRRRRRRAPRFSRAQVRLARTTHDESAARECNKTATARETN